MNHWRMNHHAIRLLDGRVLVVGGDEYGKPLDYRGTAELFDPVSGTWSLTGSLNVPRGGFTATLLPNGGVLVAGGVDRSDDTLGWVFNLAGSLLMLVGVVMLWMRSRARSKA